jgi:hypothetical protein
MSQSRVGSGVESVVNVAIGYGVAVSAQMAIFPLYGVQLPVSANLEIGVIFTLISLARSYILRRVGNRLFK